MMFTYLFVVLAHLRFPYTDPAQRSRGGAKLVAGGAAAAMLAVLVAMCFMSNKQPEMLASGACLALIVIALLVRNALRRGPSAARSGS
jgi:L-asparagine transporter-like permease